MFGDQLPPYLPGGRQGAHHVAFTGTEGFPGAGGGFMGSLFNMGASMMLPGQMAKMSMAPMGISDRNLHDRMRSQDFTRRHAEAVRRSAEADRQRLVDYGVGMANIWGAPMGPDQREALDSLAGLVTEEGSFLNNMLPTLVAAAPRQVDKLGGRRGLNMVMTHFASMAGKHRIDPTTGQMGMSSENVNEMTQGIMDEMYAGRKYLDAPMSAGMMGEAMHALQMRGMMPGRGAALDQMGTADPGRMRELMQMVGVDTGRPFASLTPAEQAQVRAAPGAGIEGLVQLAKEKPDEIKNLLTSDDYRHTLDQGIRRAATTDAPEVIDRILGAPREFEISDDVEFWDEDNWDSLDEDTRYRLARRPENRDRLFNDSEFSEGLLRDNPHLAERLLAEPGMKEAALDRLAAADPGRMQALMESAGIDSGERGFDRLTAEERDKLRASPEVSAELKSHDAAKTTKTLKDWGSAIEAMREIFGDAGNPDAPMPQLIEALNQLTGGSGLGQLNPAKITDIVRTTSNLAKNSGIGMEAASIMTEQAVAEAQMMGLDPIFASRAVQETMAFASAYQGEEIASVSAWGRGDMSRHQEQHRNLVLSAAASQQANQAGMAVRMDKVQSFAADSDAAKYLNAVRAGETTFAGGRSTLMTEDEFTKMIATGGTMSQQEARFALQAVHGNREEVFKTPGIINMTRALQRGEFIEQQLTPMGAQTAGAFLRDKMGDKFDDVAAEPMGAMLTRLGQVASETFMGMSNEAAGDPVRRNAIVSKALRDEVVNSDNPAAQAILASYGGDVNAMTQDFVRMSEHDYQAKDQYLQTTGQGTIQDAHVLHNEQLQRSTNAAMERSQTQAAAGMALSSTAKGGLLRRTMEALIDVDSDDEQALLRAAAKAFGGVEMDSDVMLHLADMKGDEIDPATGKKVSKLKQIHDKGRELREAEAAAYEKGLSPKERAKRRKRVEKLSGELDAHVKEVAGSLEEAGIHHDVAAADLGVISGARMDEFRTDIERYRMSDATVSTKDKADILAKHEAMGTERTLTDDSLIVGEEGGFTNEKIRESISRGMAEKAAEEKAKEGEELVFKALSIIVQENGIVDGVANNEESDQQAAV